ncbi:MAG: HAMP domain-containing sensor histidine kinase [Bacteroidetes bacterium]|nr:HAMP domain-containing sensor histidine kinase [Bacteroidota bacterium]
MQIGPFIRKLLRNRFSHLVLALAAFVAAYLLSLSISDNAITPGISAFENTIHQKEKALNSELDSLIKISSNKPFNDVFRLRPLRYNSLFREKGFVLLIYESDTLKFWSDNSVSVENYMKEVCLDDRMVKLKNGWFEVLRKPDVSGRTYIGMLLIKNNYSYQNKYLINSFEKDFQLPPETDIAIGKENSATSIHAADGSYLFSLVFKSNGPVEIPEWRTWMNLLFNLSGFLFVLLFIRSESIALKNSIGRNGSLLLFVGSVILLRFLTIQIHFPETFYSLPLFGPKYYGDANSFWLSNLGDFLINACLLFYLSFYITKHLKEIKIKSAFPVWKKIVFGILLLLIPSFGAWLLNGMIIGLVQNSNISFNVNNVFDLDIYSYVGLLLIAILLATFFIIADRCARILQQLIVNRGLRWNVFAIALLIHTGALHLFGYVDLIAVMWPFAIILLLLVWRRDASESIFSFSLIVFLVFVFSFYCTRMLIHQDSNKEHESRVLFAENLAEEQDPIGEHEFTEFENKLATDSLLISYSQSPNLDLSAFEKRVQQQYFSGYWDKYDVKVTFFDTMCTPILRSNSIYSENINRFDELIEKDGGATLSKNFFYIKNSSGRISYLARIILQKQGHEKPLGQGTLFVELDSKLISEEIGFPELLLDRSLGINEKLINYSYAKYKNGQMVNHSGKFQYRLTPETFGKTGPEIKFFEIDGWCHLVYRPDVSTVVILSKPDEGWLSITTSFSYIFAIFSLLLLVSLSLRQLILVGPTFSNLSFKYRIQLVLVMIVLVSLGLFGGGSIYYIRQQYQAKNAEIISEKGHSVVLELQALIEENKLNNSYKEYTTYKLKTLSNVFFTEINLYDIEGNLYATSRPKVFDEGLISKKMNPEAYLQISIDKKSEFIHDENIGNLAYLSDYLPVKNKNGQLQAYLNLPYFAKQNDLEKEISSFLVALINVYVLLFALSVLAAIFISNYLTHPLRLIQEKMRQVKLGKTSDQIEWKNKDEIGSLVTEYNRMIQELAKSAELLAQSERESAWREMAKQVAHEIKNPLTPMRLSIQLLQRAYADKAPDIDQKVERLSKTMIEQIDTLASIATAFSDFAKMPKPNNDGMDLRELTKNAIDLFHETSESTDFVFHDHGISKAWICADKEQLIRVFNNLFRNAIQAIPEDRKGRIDVTLSKQNQNFIVAVKDNGAGIADEVFDKIFVPNFTTKTTGMGLGLAMVKNIVESCNGQIWFETSKGKGTTFYVSFPEYAE